MADAKPSRRPLTDEELDDFAVVTPADVDTACAWWNPNCSPAMVGLLDARTEQPGERKAKAKREK